MSVVCVDWMGGGRRPYVVCVGVSLLSKEVTRWGDVRVCGREYCAPGRNGLAQACETKRERRADASCRYPVRDI